MSSTLKNRIERLEGRVRPGTVLIALAEPGETIQAAVERVAHAWQRPVEAFRVLIALNFRGTP